MNNILDKILEITSDIEKLKKDKKVLVMHFSCAEICKDFITRYSHITEPLEAFMFDNRVQVFFTSYIPKFHCSIMSMSEYEVFKSKTGN
jgi:hypothetical protein